MLTLLLVLNSRMSIQTWFLSLLSLKVQTLLQSLFLLLLLLLFWFLLLLLIVVLLLQLLLPLHVMLVVFVFLFFLSYITLTLPPRTYLFSHLGGARKHHEFGMVPTWRQMCPRS